MLKQYLTTLAARFSFPLEEKEKPERLFLLTIDEETKLTFIETSSGFKVNSLITETPKDLSEELLILLLKANFLGQGTKGGVIGLSEFETHFLFTKVVDEISSDLEFKEMVEDFVNYLNYWKSRINEELQKSHS